MLAKKIKKTARTWNEKRLKRSLLAALTVGTFLPAIPAFAAEQVDAAMAGGGGTQTVDDTAVDAETNESTSGFLFIVDSFTTAERIPTSRLDTPANVHVITAAEIEANHYQDIYEALQHVNGIYASHVFNEVEINGSERIVVLLDGQRLDNDSGIGERKSVDMHIIPSMKMIERIEIVKGGGSALYGSDAVGGVINIITKKGDYNETTLDFNTGSWHRHNYELTNQGVAGKFGWFITGGLHKSNLYKDYESDEINNTDYDDKTLSLRLDNRFNDRSSLTLNYLHRSHDYGQYVDYDDGLDFRKYLIDTGFAEGDISMERSENYNNLSLSYNFKEDTSTPGFLRYFNNRKTRHLPRTSFDAYLDDDGSIDYIDIDHLIFDGFNYFLDYDTKARMQGIDYQNGWEFGKHKLIAGLEWHQNKASFRAHGYEGVKVIDRSYYLQDTMSMDDKWTLVPGVRLDHHSSYGNHWSPKVAANYRADDKTKVYASWGRVYRNPTIENLNAIYAERDIDYILGDAYTSTELNVPGSLEPETGHTETIGLEHDFNDTTSLSVSFFNTKLKDRVSYRSFGNYWNDYETYLATNRGTEKQRGLELSFRQAINDNLSYALGYSHIHREVDDSDSSYLNYYPQPNGYRIGLYYNNRAFKANLQSIMGSGIDTNHFNTGNYAIFNINTSYDIADWATVYLKLNNITKKNYVNDSPRTWSPGRLFVAGAQFKF